jgi:hypothetical protein
MRKKKREKRLLTIICTENMDPIHQDEIELQSNAIRLTMIGCATIIAEGFASISDMAILL